MDFKVGDDCGVDTVCNEIGIADEGHFGLELQGLDEGFSVEVSRANELSLKTDENRVVADGQDFGLRNFDLLMQGFQTEFFLFTFCKLESLLMSVLAKEKFDSLGVFQTARRALKKE